MTLRIPPVLQVIIFGALSWAAARLLPALAFSIDGVPLIGWGLIALAGVILLLSVQTFVRAETTVNPVSPDQANKLVVSGLYRFSRNPMYLAMALLLTGGALILENFAALIGPALFVAAMTYLQIKPEECALQEKFGDEYAEYCQRTRRWI